MLSKISKVFTPHLDQLKKMTDIIIAALHVHLGRNPTAEGETKAYYTDGNMHRCAQLLVHRMA